MQPANPDFPAKLSLAERIRRYAELSRRAAWLVRAEAGQDAQLSPVAVDSSPFSLAGSLKVRATAVVGWRHQRWYVTTVRLENEGPDSVALDAVVTSL